MAEQKATFAAGCFWGVQDYFDKLDGVSSTEVGYTGGRTKNPTYEEVCQGDTGHAEAVQIIFDPGKISYETLLDHFWKMHNPTTKDRQGPDAGEQYRSAIFCHSDEQKKQALASKEKMNKEKFSGKITTEIAQAKEFFRAEEYHQHYHEKKGGSCLF